MILDGLGANFEELQDYLIPFNPLRSGRIFGSFIHRIGNDSFAEPENTRSSRDNDIIELKVFIWLFCSFSVKPEQIAL